MLRPPIEPMLAAPLGHELPPTIEGLSFEPKWDGFRCLVFRDDSTVILQGRGRSRGSSEDVVDLGYAFPELVAECQRQLPPGTVIDGEIVMPHEGRLDFGMLSSRLRPRSEAGGPSIAKLANEHPATLLAFDLLWWDRDYRDETFSARRSALETLATSWSAPLLLTPSTTDAAIAWRWFTDFESAGIDGLMVKPLADPYQPGVRAQGKVKHLRTADVVVAGWRPHTKPGKQGEPVVGSLLLGLHDSDGVLHYVGVASAFTSKVRADLVRLLEPFTTAEGESHPWRGTPKGRVPGEANRWKKEQPWLALRPDLVAEVAYDQTEGHRFRHVAAFQRWRPDRSPASCDYAQLQTPPASHIEGLLPLE